MTGAELHAQAALWNIREWRFATLFMEGEAADKANGGAMLVDALHSVALARGLPLVTELTAVRLRPVTGWRIHISVSGAITVEWPHAYPLLEEAPIELPPGWLEATAEQGIVLVFTGHGLGLHEHAEDGHAHAATRVRRVAQNGGLAGGAVLRAGAEQEAARLGGTARRPRPEPRHRRDATTNGDGR